MPTILLKKSDTPGSVPGTANLTNLAGGVEVAVNTADKRVYSMTSASAVIELGTNPSSLTCADVSATVFRSASATITNLIATSASITTLTNNPTFGAGTANGVLYLNGSKVATSGSALQFDGTGKLALGNVAHISFIPATALTLGNSAANVEIRMGQQDTNALISKWVYNATVGSAYGAIETYGQTNYIQFGASDFRWQVASSERMRLTSSVLSTDSSINLGIGTASPAQKLDVTGGARFYSAGNWMQFGVNALESLNNDGGYIRAVISTASNPTYSWQGDQNTGIFTPAADTIGVTTGGTERMRLTSSVLSTDSSINLGIGTTSPGFKLDVQGSATDFVAFNGLNTNNNAGTITSSAIKFGFTSTVGTHYATLKITEDSVNSNSGGLTISLPNGGVETPLLALTSAGNLGIGTASPGYKLHVVDNSTGTQVRVASSSSGGTSQSFINTATNGRSYRIGSNFVTGTGEFALYDDTAGAARLTVDSSGNLGLGTASPETTLHLNKATAGGAGPYLMLDNSSSSTLNSTAGISFSLDSGSTFSGYSARIEGVNTNAGNGASAITFSTWDGAARQERARITSVGEFLVGTTATNSGARLDVKGVDSTSSNYCVFFENSSSALLLAVQNDGRWRSGTAAASPYNFVVGATNRDLFVDNAGEIGYVSSVRASKTNITPDVDTDWLLQLNPVTFNFRKRDEEGNYTDEADGPIKHGLIAEEVEEVNVDLCFYDDEDKGGALRGVNYSHLITPMLKLIQKQQAAIAALEADMAALKGAK